MNDAVKSVTVAVSLSVTDTTFAVVPSGNNSLSPSINSEVNLDATPVIVSSALFPSAVPNALPVNVKLSSNKTSPANSWNKPVPLS